MSPAATLLLGVLWWAGATLLLTGVPALSRPSPGARVAPYVPGGSQRTDTDRTPARTARELLAPTLTRVGEVAAGVLGSRDALDRRLALLHSPLDATAFRLRQLGWCGAATAASALVVAATAPTTAAALALLVAAPALTFVLWEEHLSRAVRRRREQLAAELPVLTEQLGLLLGAGYSLGASLTRLAARGTGTSGGDLRRVVARVSHGLTDHEALGEWASLTGIDALDRLVAVLHLDRSTGDLSTLVAEEARAMRHDAHRQLIESVERRTQQVWVPVTVAALVPGIVFIAIPFIEALRRFTT